MLGQRASRALEDHLGVHGEDRCQCSHFEGVARGRTVRSATLEALAAFRVRDGDRQGRAGRSESQYAVPRRGHVDAVGVTCPFKVIWLHCG